MKKHKRMYRELTDKVKNKISLSARNKPKTLAHRRHLAEAMRRYWRTVPHRPDNNDVEPLNPDAEE